MKIKVALETKDTVLTGGNECDLCVFDPSEICPSKYCGMYEYFVITEIDDNVED